MDLPESGDEKFQLIQKTNKYREELQENVKLISENTEKIIINALIIGGTLTLTYLLVRQFTSSSKPDRKKAFAPSSHAPEQHTEKEETTGVLQEIGQSLMQQATVFLLNIAREKLVELLAPKSQNDITNGSTKHIN